MKKIVLGIDCSSTTIGWGVLQIDDQANDIIYLDSGYFKPPKDGHIVERIAQTRDWLVDLMCRINPNYIAIEQIVEFMKGKSTAKTIIMLTTFNRSACLIAYDYLGSPPELYNVMTIRHGLKLDKELPKKEEMPELVAYRLGIDFPYELITKGKNKGKPKTESYDIADGISVALYYAMKLTNKLPTKKKTKKKAKTK